ncbi:MAG: putative ABC transporter ATP-binding protein YejF [Paracidovorax wautersii]|uniref:Putative ABC transporter ATP-binding protein YejF n=1 Tax=Paracidovorax wautersii TaxID=1177982 RepID=A0A7V8FKR5_9BURK|nr:MAG: putative ABC transporter ATP-binding protein YejF [Paracidovorax wautersii]
MTTVSSSQPDLLRVEGLRIGFDGQDVVHGVSFTIRPGEKLALVGESGSGKSISAMSLLRLVPDADIRGQAVFDGRDLLALKERELRAVRGREIAMIFQEPMTALNPLYTVGHQIAEVFQLKKGLGRREAWGQAIERLRETGIPEPERRANAYPHQLSGGQRQRAMIAMALAVEPRLLVADEPTTALDVTLRQQILELLAQLQRKNGMAVLMITHDLNLVRRFADRVAVMEHGHLVEQGPVAQIFEQPQHPYTRKLIESRPERDVVEPLADDSRALLQGSTLRVAYPINKPGIRGWFSKGEFVAVKGADFELRGGRTLGVIGESGSGKSTLALAVLGLVRHQGELLVDGTSWSGANQQGFAAQKALRRKVQVVFQDPYSSLSPRMTVEEIVSEGLRFHEPDLDAAARAARVVQALADVGLTERQFPGLLARYPHEFSGGQRQRLAIARALIIEPEVLVLDEPTSALDVTIQKQVLALLQRLQKERSLSYLLITHDVDVIRAMAHEVMVMKDGEIVERGSVASVMERPAHSYTQRLLAAAA